MNNLIIWKSWNVTSHISSQYLCGVRVRESERYLKQSSPLNTQWKSFINFCYLALMALNHFAFLYAVKRNYMCSEKEKKSFCNWGKMINKSTQKPHLFNYLYIYFHFSLSHSLSCSNKKSYYLSAISRIECMYSEWERERF